MERETDCRLLKNKLKNLLLSSSSEGGKRNRQHVSFSSGGAVERETDRKFKLLSVCSFGGWKEKQTVN